MDIAAVRRRFRYHAWATARLAAVITASEEHAEMRRLLAHVLAADRVWLDRLRDAVPDRVEVWPTRTAEAIRALVPEQAEAYRVFLGGLTEADGVRTIAYHNTKGVRYETAVADILDHVLLHGAYHRGQVARALRQSGTAPPPTDFIVWVREGA